MATSSIIYSRSGDRLTVTTDPARRDFYRDALLVHTFKDVIGHVPADEDNLLRTDGTVFSSTSSATDPSYAHNFYLGSSDGNNGCWAPDPPNATPEYVGVRFSVPVTVTGFQFASGVLNADKAPYGVGPCAYPTAFRLEASNDETSWTELLAITDFTACASSTPASSPTSTATGGTAARACPTGLMCRTTTPTWPTAW